MIDIDYSEKDTEKYNTQRTGIYILNRQGLTKSKSRDSVLNISPDICSPREAPFFHQWKLKYFGASSLAYPSK